jgi:hypothetical protein
MALVQQGWGGRGVGPPTGWLGRYADGLRNAASESLYSVTFGWNTPLALVGGRNRPSGLPMSIGGAFGINRSNTSTGRLFDHVAAYGREPTGLGRFGDGIAATQANYLQLAQRIRPVYSSDGLPSGGDQRFARQMVLAARLINENFGIRVIHTGIGGFDTHANQLDDHADLLTRLDVGIERFFRTLTRAWRRQAVVVVFSEFGRRPEENGDRGTDHGTSGLVFVIGELVNGGLHGRQPSLAPSALEEWWGNMPVEVDYRSVYATLLRRWMRADAAEILGRRFPNLDLFRATL